MNGSNSSIRPPLRLGCLLMSRMARALLERNAGLELACSRHGDIGRVKAQLDVTLAANHDALVERHADRVRAWRTLTQQAVIEREFGDARHDHWQVRAVDKIECGLRRVEEGGGGELALEAREIGAG